MARDKLPTTRTNIYLPNPQQEKIRTLANRTGITAAEHIRRAVDFYLAWAPQALHEKAEVRVGGDYSGDT
jgi:predicted DNA-binding protein